MCDVLVRKVLAELANKGNTEYVLPPIIFTTDLDCNGTVYTSHDLQTQPTSNGDAIELCYYSYDLLQNTNTPIASALTSDNLDGQSIYLPRRYSGDIENNPKDFETSNLLTFKSILIPPQYQEIQLEGITSLNSTVIANNGVRNRFRYSTKGPTMISNASSLKYQDMYNLAVSSSSYVPLPSYYTSDLHSSIIGLVKRDLVKMGYQTVGGHWDDLYQNYISSTSDDTVIYFQYRINVTQPDDVETLIRKSCMGNLLYYGGIAIDRYKPQSPFCDQYMKHYCLTHVDEDACGCFKDEASIIAKSEVDQVALPVTCYGPNCSSKNSYKTLAMKQVPCSRMLCKQVIKGIKEAGDNVITCNGQYFNHNGQVKLIGDYYNLAAQVGDPPKLSSEYVSQVSNDRLESTMPPQPIYAWICLAMAFLMIIIFAMFYMFPPSFFTTVQENEKYVKGH